MKILTRTTAVIALLMLALPAFAEDAKPGDTITWSKDLPAAFAKGKKDKKIILICVNAKSVAGEKEEPAAKGLREVIYKDVRVVGKSREFVCAFLTPEGSSNDYGELRALGIDGAIVSPQHIFVHPDGKEILVRKQYWSHGRGESGVKALLQMMDDALAKMAGGDVPEPAQPDANHPDPGAQPAAPGADERQQWIDKMIKQVVSVGGKQRDTAIKALVDNDKDGDCVRPLTALLPENKKDTALLVAVIRGVGKDGLELAALPVAGQLSHKDPAVRANAAVTLEYIGSSEKKVLAGLRKLADKDKDVSIANHAYRALGRCGKKDAKVRALLLKKAGSAKSEFASYGACIGLAYFEGDKKAARGVEKLLKKIGVPGSRRGGGQNAVKRGLVSWTLAWVGDEKSGEFVREELMDGLKNTKEFWVAGLLRFWDTVAAVCEGDRGRIGEVETGVRGFVTFTKNMGLTRYGAETRNLMDEYRIGRDNSEFTPRGDNLLNDERDM